MAETVEGMRAEGTRVVGAEAKQGHGQWLRASAVIVALVVVLLIGGVAIHDRQDSHTATSAITVEVQPAVSGEQQKFMDMNTTWLQSLGWTAPYMENFTPESGQNR